MKNSSFSALVALSALLALVVSSCAGEDDSDAGLRCHPAGHVCTPVRDTLAAPAFFPTLAVHEGENVDVLLRGAEPGEPARVFSTIPALHRTVLRPDEDGDMRLIVGGVGQVGHHTLVVVQRRDEDEPPAIWQLVITFAERAEMDEAVLDEVRQEMGRR